MRLKAPADEIRNVLNAATDLRDECVLNLRSEGILIRVEDESQTSMYSSFIPKDVLDEYERGEHPRIGIYNDKMADALPSGNNDVVITFTDAGKFSIVRGSREYTVPPIDPDQVKGDPEKVPDLSMPVSAIFNEDDTVMDFVKEAHTYVHDRKGGGFFISANEGAMYLWTKKDDYELKEVIHWEDLADYNISWSDATTDSKGSMPIDPTQEKRIEALLSLELVKPVDLVGDTIEISWGNGMPLKAVTQSAEGIKHSWIIPPRFPTQSETKKIPDSVITERAVV